MSTLEQQIETLKQRLQRKRQEKRKADAKQRAKEQRNLDRRNLLLGRALAETCGLAKLEGLIRHLGDSKQKMTSLTDKDFQIVMDYLAMLLAQHPDSEKKS